jgi:hypothetical protein
MKVDIQELLDVTGLENEALYPGKRLVKKYVQHGEYKSHCIVLDWHDPKTFRLELKAGTSGHTLDAKELRHYPVTFQAATYLDVKTVNDNDEPEEDEDEEGSRGKSGGGGKKPLKKRTIDDPDLTSMSAFSKMSEGMVSTLGEITKFVVMGKEIAKEGYAQALENLKHQMAQTKIMVMDLMKDVGNVIKQVTPGGGLEARGTESIKYKYDAEKTAPMFGGLTPT